MPIGADPQKKGGTHFRVWATTTNIGILVSDNPQLAENAIRAELEPEGDGYFSGYVPEAKAGQYYKLKIGSTLFPDPAALAQNGGPPGPSVLLGTDRYVR